MGGTRVGMAGRDTMARRWRCFIFAGVPAALLLCFPLASRASAAQPQAATIDSCVTLATHTGTFVASGALSDTGTTALQHRILSGGQAPFIQATIEFDGGVGSFVLTTNFREYVTSNPDVFGQTGEWFISRGTGAYAGLQGQGKVTGTVDLSTFCSTYTGQVHLVGR